MSRGSLVLCCLLLACERAAAPKPAPTPTPKPTPAPVALTTWPGVAELQGTLRAQDGHALEAGDALASEQRLELTSGTALIALDKHRHVELSIPAKLYLFEEGTFALIEGGARLAVSTQASRQVPLRVATVHVTLNLGPGSEAWMQVIPALGSYVGVLSGSARLSSGTEAADGGPRILTVEANGSVFVTGELPESAEMGPATLAEAQGEGEARLRTAAAADPPLGDGGTELEAVLGAMAAARAKGQKRAAQQREAKLAGKDAKADAIRLELVEQARALHRLRELATVRFEHFRVRTLHLREATGPDRFAPFGAVSAELFPATAQAGGP